MASDTESHSQTLPSIIKEYESLIETLTSQLQFYAKEQEGLREEIDALVIENRRLGETVKELSESHLKAERAKDDETEVKLIENLKKQLNLLSKEKDTVVALWQNALKNIDHLEEQLRLFEGRTHGYYPKAEVAKIKQKYETHVTELETQLIECREHLNKTLKESAEILQNKNLEFEKISAAQRETCALTKRLEDEVKLLKKKLKEIAEMRNQLRATLDSKIGLIEELKIKDMQAKSKVTEAVQIVEVAFLEKDAALSREKEAKEEVLKISKTLTEIMEEMPEKIKSEIESVKDQYNVKLRKVEESLKTVQQTLNTKTIELEKSKSECLLQEKELERAKKGNLFIDESNTSKLLILEKNLESTFQKLLLSERKNLQLSSEKESIKADMEQMANCYENDVKAREIEKQVLKHELQTVRKQLKMSNSSLVRVADDMQKLNAKFKRFDVDVRQRIKTKEIMFEKALTKTLQDIGTRHTEVQKDLESQLQFHVELNKKWRTGIREILNKLETQMSELKNANKSLQRRLKELLRENLKYKNNLKDICKGLTSVASVNKEKINNT